MPGCSSRKRFTTGVNSRLIIGGMPTSSAPRRKSAVWRISSPSWRMVSSTCSPRWYMTRPVSVGRAVWPSRISSGVPASSSSCRIILLTVDCVTNSALAACVKLACLTVSTKYRNARTSMAAGSLWRDAHEGNSNYEKNDWIG
ncbi:hypothetical protein D3C87_1307060 [compost metagenome]